MLLGIKTFNVNILMGNSQKRRFPPGSWVRIRPLLRPIESILHPIVDPTKFWEGVGHLYGVICKHLSHFTTTENRRHQRRYLNLKYMQMRWRTSLEELTALPQLNWGVREEGFPNPPSLTSPQIQLGREGEKEAGGEVRKRERTERKEGEGGKGGGMGMDPTKFGRKSTLLETVFSEVIK